MILLRHRVFTTVLSIFAAAGAFAAEDSAGLEPAPKGISAAPTADDKWEGTIGPIFTSSPEYQGATHHKLSVTPGFYLRRGRWSISNQGAFVTRRADDVFRGLALDAVHTDRVRVNLALRLDNGRRSSDSEALAGIENVRRTVRMRSSVTWQLDDNWKVAAGLNTDLLGRGGGNVIDIGIGHDRRVSPRIVWNVGGGVNWADGRYMRSWYGVNASESAASRYPVYTPGSGLRDVGVSTSFRMEINPRWTALWGASYGKLLGPAAGSPLTTSTRQWSLNGGIGWRF
jgi:outer membrane scaffolding protein for murein synthesis (MipA/OmpV family)